ncbi:MAG: DUF4142 domain-containing protein [Acetobacteraceae bacterium]
MTGMAMAMAADPDSAGASGGSGTGTDGPSTGGAQGQDAMFVQKAAVSGLLEVEQGRAVVERLGADTAVGEFGLWMAGDHAALNAVLKTLAEREGIPVPSALPQDAQAELQTLQALDDSEFPGIYVTWQVIHHVDAVMTFLDQAENGESAALRGFAGDALPILGHHLQEAATLYAEQGGDLSDIDMETSQVSALIQAALGDDYAGLAGDMGGSMSDLGGSAGQGSEPTRSSGQGSGSMSMTEDGTTASMMAARQQA